MLENTMAPKYSVRLIVHFSGIVIGVVVMNNWVGMAIVGPVPDEKSTPRTAFRIGLNYSHRIKGLLFC